MSNRTLPIPILPARTAPAVPAAPSKGGHPRRDFWLVWLGSWLLRLLWTTLRLRVEICRELRERVRTEPFIFVFWHNRLLLIPVVWNRFLHAAGRPRGRALTSLSSDGELVAMFLDRFGVGAVRGSATRGGAASVRELTRWLRRGHDIGLTPDGSRGPCYEIKPGLVLLAQLSGRSILPLSFEYSRAWRLKSWDRFFIPKPFSTVRFTAGAPHAVRRTTTPEAFEDERRRCETVLLSHMRER